MITIEFKLIEEISYKGEISYKIKVYINDFYDSMELFDNKGDAKARLAELNENTTRPTETIIETKTFTHD